jgi:hypothetical protein
MAARLGLIFALCALLAGAAQAQQYQRLHVRSFTLTSDAANPQLEQPFHVTLTIRVAEKVARLQNVFLPTFYGAEELGDVSQTAQSAAGTTYRETLTLVAHERGPLAISSAYLDAIDARDGKAKRFISNSLRLTVGAGPVSTFWDALRTAGAVAIDLLLVAAVIFVVAAIFWRRRSAAAPQVPEPAPFTPAPPPEPPVNEIDDAFDRLRRSRDRASVLQLRSALWHAAGGSMGETLSDVLRRPAASDERLRRLLMIVERAAFIEAGRLDEAIEEVLCNPR